MYICCLCAALKHKSVRSFVLFLKYLFVNEQKSNTSSCFSFFYILPLQLHRPLHLHTSTAIPLFPNHRRVKNVCFCTPLLSDLLFLASSVHTHHFCLCVFQFIWSFFFYSLDVSAHQHPYIHCTHTHPRDPLQHFLTLFLSQPLHTPHQSNIACLLHHLF